MTCERLGITFDPWQRDGCFAILAKNMVGLYAADLVLLSIARQVGKTFLVGAIVFADCITNPGTLTVWTAHRFKVARESFDELRALAESPAMAAHVDKDAITTAAGNEVIPFRNGSRIVFAARERGSIRGFRKVRRLVLDEAQILSDAALSDLAPTQNQATNPQIILMGTPPKPSDPSEAWTRIRTEALSGEAEGVAYIEFSADPGSDPDDMAQLAKANPSYPHRTPERAIKRLRRLLDDDDFLREVMGIWTDEQANKGALDAATWNALADAGAPLGTGLSFGVATAPDGSWSCIAFAWRRPDGGVQVMVDRYAPGAEWLAARAAELQRKYAGAFTANQAAKGMVAGAQEPSQGVQAQAHVAFETAVRGGTVHHGNQAELNVAVKASRWKSYGDTRMFDRKGSTDITPLDAAALAVHGLDAQASTGGWVMSL